MSTAAVACVRARGGRDAQAGAAAVTSLLFLMVMAAFLALSINMGLLMDTRTQLQVGSDAAALAAAGRLDGTTTGLTNARNAAVHYSNQHVAYGESLIIDPVADVIYGRWHYSSSDCIARPGTCTGFEPFEDGFAQNNPARVTAIRVRNGRDGGTHNSVLSLPFGSFLGTPTASVRSAAVAVGGGTGAVDCALPIGVALCKIRPNQGSSALACGQPLNFSDANNDEAGFVSFTSDPANGNNASDFIDSGMCAPGEISVGGVRVQNGNGFGQVVDALRGEGRGSHAGTGNCLIGTPQQMPVVEAGCNDSWGNPTFNRDSAVVGFVRVTIRAVTNNQGDVLGCPGDPTPTLTGSTPPNNALVLEFDCDQDDAPPGALGGGEILNSSGATIRLVE
jgi:hypothetical protein